MTDQTKPGPTLRQDGGPDMEEPQALNVVDYAGARAREMEAMAAVSVRTWGNNKAMQTLPRHMRRRAASHNVKRLPRRLQEKGRREMRMARAGNPVAAKRPSRRHRRRPGNLLEEYTRRARSNVWLETHIWHAKRFHMGTQWGYRIPLHPNDKGVRAAYRGAAKFCIMRDISFLCCVELNGPQATLLRGFLRLCSVETGPTPAAARFISGTREGEALFFRHDQYPRGALGPVKFLWRPTPSSANALAGPTTACAMQRRMWLWIHPAVYQDVLNELVTIFTLEKQVKPRPDDDVDRDKTDKNTDKSNKNDANSSDNSKTTSQTNGNIEGEKKTVDNVRPSALYAPSYSNGDVTLTSLKDLLCRFSLSGPLSHSILLDLLKLADIRGMTTPTPEENQSFCDMDTTESDQPNANGAKWWQWYFSCATYSSMHSHQGELWSELQGLQSAGELAESVVLGLTTRDPRTFLPRKKMRVTDDPAAASECTLEAVKSWPCDVADSPIWDRDVRHQVKSSKMTEADLNKLRTEHLVPGTELKLGNDESRIPILLIQHSGPRPHAGRPQETSSLSGVPLQWGAGWDLVLPQSWAMAFWVGLVYRGARACGMKESLSTATEMGQLHFPESFPDTPTGHAAELSRRVVLEGKYKKMPPAKRPNFVKLGTAAPFHHPWERLVADWTCGDVEVVVLRNKRLLSQLDHVCSGQYQQQWQSGPPNKVRKVALQQRSARGDHGATYKAAILGAALQLNTWLVAVRVRAMHRGVLEPFSTICVPTDKDMETLQVDTKHGGPLELPHHDPTAKQLKRKRKGDRNTKGEGTGEGEENTEEGKSNRNNEAMLRTMNSESNGGETTRTNGHNDEKMQKEETLQKDEHKTKGLCGDVSDMRRSCSRPVFGQVTQGGYHFCEGRGAGIGFVVLEGLRALLQARDKNESMTIVLVRSPRSNQYRYATLSVLS